MSKVDTLIEEFHRTGDEDVLDRARQLYADETGVAVETLAQSPAREDLLYDLTED